MFKKTRLNTCLALAFGSAITGFAVAPAPALAQTAERIEITGSLIRRIEGETALPVVTLKADDLLKAGVTNAEQVVKFITQQQGGTVTSGSVSGTNGAAAYASLRSLGAGRTLVLVNGRRLVSNPFSSLAVDLNSLPTAALERVETLTDGASAIYGTDAIAGVINFVLKKDYKGVSIGGSLQSSEDGGAGIKTGTLLAGIGDLSRDRWNAYVGFNYREQDPMNGRARKFMETSYQPALGFNGLSPTTFPANYTQGTITGNPSLAAGCLPPTSISAPEANGTNIRCFADTQFFTSVVPIQEQWGVFGKAQLALGDHLIAFEALRTNNLVSTQIAPSPEGGLQVLPASPFYPGGSGGVPADSRLNTANPVNVNWRTTTLGPRRGQQENDTHRFVLSAEGSLGNWQYQAAALKSRSRVVNNFIGGWPMTPALRAGVRGDGRDPVTNQTFEVVALNPFGAQTAAGQAYMEKYQVLGQVQDGTGNLDSLTGTLSGDLFKLPGGAAQLAINAESRKEDMVYNTDVPKVSQAASSGLAGSGATRVGDRDIQAVSAELSLPLAKSLEVNLSVRHDRYSDFGNTTNPKVAISFRPTSNLLIRASYNTGFSAPTLTSLYAPNSTTFTANRFNDPLLCPGGVAGPNAVPAQDCGIQFQRLTGGNPGLTPEESKAGTIGFVFQPTPNWSVGLDYWDYKVTNNVSTLGEQTIFGDPVKYASLFVRCSQAPVARRNLIGACQNPIAGRDALAYILETNQNLGDTVTDGVDVTVTWNSGATAYGRFNAALRGSYISHYYFQVEPRGAWFNPLAQYSPQFGGPVIRYNQALTLGWEAKGGWSFTLGNRLLSGYRDQNANAAPFNVAPFNNRNVGSYSLWDTSVTYTGIKGLTLSLAIQNLMNQDPPFTNQVGRFQARGYDDRFHNPIGRTYQVSAKYQF
jgi:iron complex outermembrane recepter protein